MIGPDSAGRVLAKVVASVPATVDPTYVRRCIATYYATYAVRDPDTRESLFADNCRFEDPAGRIVATDRASLHRFFTEFVPPTWSIAFHLDRVAVVGNEALATTVMRLDIADRTPVDVMVNAHFTFTDAGLIGSVRTFFDEDAMAG